jgi:hypothetical protein
MSTNIYPTHDSHLKEARLPLLTEDCATNEHPDVENIQVYAFILLGLLVGTCMQLSTILGAEFLVISVLSREGLPTLAERIVWSLLYGFGTSIMAVVVLVFMRKLVSSVYYMRNGRTKISEDSLQYLLRKYEYSIFMGALVGVGVASAATGRGIMFPLIFTWLSCYVFFCCFDSCNDNHDDDEENEQTYEEDFHTQSSGGYQNCMVV